jgi:hypothetical protein
MLRWIAFEGCTQFCLGSSLLLFASTTKLSGPLGTIAGLGGMGGGDRTGKQPDWVCSDCGNKNFGWRQFCNRCKVGGRVCPPAGQPLCKKLCILFWRLPWIDGVLAG